MKNKIITLLFLFLAFNSYASISPITGSDTGTGYYYCTGTSIILGDSTTGGIWSSSDTSILAVTNSLSGNFYAVSSGTVTVTYTVGGSFVTTSLIIAPVPSPITGSNVDGGMAVICYGDTITLYDSTPGGGDWHGDGTTYLTFLGASAATNFISLCSNVSSYNYVYFQNPITACQVKIEVVSEGPITGDTLINVDSITTLHNGFLGRWSSGNTSVAIIDSITGVVKGISEGITTITFTTLPGLECVTTISLTVLPPTFISPTYQSNGGNIKLYPNPTKGNVTFTSTDRGELKITNTTGELIETILIKEDETMIPTEQLPAGLYFVTFQSASYNQTEKLIVE